MTKQESSENSPLLDTLETSVDETPPSTLRNHLTKHNPDEIEASRDTYRLWPGKNTDKRLERFDQCKTRAWFARHAVTGEVKVLSNSCKLRWCPLCSNAKKYHLAGQVKEWLHGVDRPKFLTLTLKHTHNTLENQVNDLYQSFRKLRLFKEYKKLIKGGVWFFQIKKSSKDEMWHPHLHCVIESKFIDHSKLWKTWLRITGTSKVVDIRSVKSDQDVAEYVARYAARPSDLAELELSDQLELVSALHGRRLVGAWGTARGVSLSPSKPQDADDWKNVGTWGLISFMYGHDIRANAIWKAFKLGKPLDADVSLYEFEREMNDKGFREEISKKTYLQKSFEFS